MKHFELSLKQSRRATTHTPLFFCIELFRAVFRKLSRFRTVEGRDEFRMLIKTPKKLRLTSNLNGNLCKASSGNGAAISYAARIGVWKRFRCKESYFVCLKFSMNCFSCVMKMVVVYICVFFLQRRNE